jgi:hypothetical protein
MLFISSVYAFCGTFVGPLDSDLENSASSVILARDGNRTALTLAFDFSGDTSEFGLVIPVPEVLEREDVTLVDPSAFDALADYTAPRLVEYSCDDFVRQYAYDYAAADADSGGASSESAEGVTVESQFQVGAYDIVVLSATGADGLLSWLDSHGYSLSESTEPLLQEYIDSEYYFLAASVVLEEDFEIGAFLSPLQFRYESESFGLPIRIGTSVSPGVQEVVLHTLTRDSAGKVSIANYPQGSLEDECMLPSENTDPGTYFNEQLDKAFNEGRWVEEYAWGIGSCDPCSSEPPDSTILAELGADWTDEGVYITRLRARFTPDQANQDLNLYLSNIYDTSQIRYILYQHQLESYLPVCGIGMVEDDPGTCEEDSGLFGEGGDPSKSTSCGCSNVTASLSTLLLLPLALAWRRKGISKD